jgi:hypothetical protein
VIQKQITVECEVMTDSGQSLEDGIGHSDTGKTEGKI